jgi:hypothetical protein
LASGRSPESTASTSKWTISRLAAEHGQALLGDRRPAREKAGQLGLGEAEKVSYAHCVEDAAALAGPAEVGVAVDVDQSGIWLHPLHAGEYAKRDRAVATQHDEHRVRCRGPLHRVRESPGRAHSSARIACRSAGLVDPEDLLNDITNVGNPQPGRRDGIDEAARAQCGRCPLLTGMMRTSAGRGTEHDHPTRYGHGPSLSQVPRALPESRTA